jgi:hypothetical protein
MALIEPNSKALAALKILLTTIKDVRNLNGLKQSYSWPRSTMLKKSLNVSESLGKPFITGSHDFRLLQIYPPTCGLLMPYAVGVRARPYHRFAHLHRYHFYYSPDFGNAEI